jgi:hypothetical protein
VPINLNNKNGKKDCLLLPISNLIPALLIFQCNDGKYPRLSIQYPHMETLKQNEV